MAKTFVNGAALPASDLNTNMMQPATAGTGTRIVKGITAVPFSASNAEDVTITYGFTFGAAPTMVATVHIGSAFEMVVNWNTAPGTSSVSARVFQADNVSISGTAQVHWIAIGSA